MKKKKRKKISLNLKLIYLLIITVIVVNFSMARYKTTYQGDLQGSTANWVFKVNGQTQSFIIDLVNTVNTNSPFIDKYAYTEGVIAPAAKGDFTITIDCTDCDVATDYEIIITPNTELPKDLYIYSTFLNPNKTTILNKTIHRTITVEELTEDPIINIPIQWMWQVNWNKTESNFEGEHLQINVTVTGKQHI